MNIATRLLSAMHGVNKRLIEAMVFAKHTEEIEVALATGLRADAKTCVHI